MVIITIITLFFFFFFFFLILLLYQKFSIYSINDMIILKKLDLVLLIIEKFKNLIMNHLLNYF